MNLNVERFHGTSLQGFGYHKKSCSYIKSAIDLWEKDVGTIHELSLSRVSGYTYLIFTRYLMP
jgi:hypothetical protein